MASLYASPPREQRRSQIPVISVGVSPDFLGRRGGRARPTGAPPRNTSTSQHGNPTSPAQRYAAQSAAAAAEEAGPAVDVDDGDTSSLYELSSISGDEEEAGYGRRHLSPTSHRPSGTAARVTHSAANHAPNRGGGYSTAFRADPDSGSAAETWVRRLCFSFWASVHWQRGPQHCSLRLCGCAYIKGIYRKRD